MNTEITFVVGNEKITWDRQLLVQRLKLTDDRLEVHGCSPTLFRKFLEMASSGNITIDSAKEAFELGKLAERYEWLYLYARCLTFMKYHKHWEDCLVVIQYFLDKSYDSWVAKCMQHNNVTRPLDFDDADFLKEEMIVKLVAKKQWIEAYPYFFSKMLIYYFRRCASTEAKTNSIIMNAVKHIRFDLMEPDKLQSLDGIYYLTDFNEVKNILQRKYLGQP